MAYECFEVEIDDGVGLLRLARPGELNTMSPAFWRELPALLAELDGGGDVRVAVLSSTGRHFSAGMDLGVFAEEVLTPGGDPATGEGTPPPPVEEARRRARLRQLVGSLQACFTAVEQARFPVLAAVQGGCVGGAVDLVTACDCRYATEDAFFVVQETNLGMVADLGTLQRLPRLVPEGLARELAYTGRRLPAAEALAAGLVNQVFPTHEELLDGVVAIARQVAARSPLAVWGTKEALVHARDHTVADGLDRVATWQAGMFPVADMAESLQARGEGREPAYGDLLPPPGDLDG